VNLQRPIQEAQNAVESVSETIKSSISILSDKRRCGHCRTPMEATQVSDPDTGAFYEGVGSYRPGWECPDCGAKYRREPEDVTFDPFDR